MNDKLPLEVLAAPKVVDAWTTNAKCLKILRLALENCHFQLLI